MGRRRSCSRPTLPTWSTTPARTTFYVAFIEAALPHLVDRAPIYQWHANTRQALVNEAYHTKPGDLCFEPFLGSGTCLIAAEITGRRCFGMDQEPSYVDVAVKRWEQLTGKTAVRIPVAEREGAKEVRA